MNLPRPYSERISSLEKAIGAELFVTGGWALSSLLHRHYAGDIDVITTATNERIVSAAQAASFNTTHSARGAVRIQFEDWNHLDISSSRSFGGATTIIEALERFNYSANSIAIHPQAREPIRTKANVTDIERRSFGISNFYQFLPRDEIGNFIKMDTLEYFFRLSANADKKTQETLRAKELKAESLQNSLATNLLSTVSEEIQQIVPHGCRKWLARGIVRSVLTKSISYWDDFDVIVDCGLETVLKHLEAQKRTYTLNFFHRPKVLLANGQKVDIIPIQGDDQFINLLQSFPLRLDAIAWSIDNQSYCDPLLVLSDIDQRIVRASDRFQEISPSDKRYAALKAIFLASRHMMSIDPTLTTLINEPLDFTVFDHRNATRLAAELLSYGIDDASLSHHFEGSTWKHGAALQLMRHYMAP